MMTTIMKGGIKTMQKKGKNWVDYRDLKKLVTMEMVLNRYGLMDNLKASGSSLSGCCPIHHGTNPRQFIANLQKNVFNCFGDCGGGGNVIDFVAKMEKVELRQAALLLKNWFLADAPTDQTPAPGPAPQKTALSKDTKLVREEKTTGANEPKINPPLTFQLKNLDLDHPFFVDRGIAPATVEHFGLGYCSKGMMAGRVVIPIHNERGELVAYCGRAVTKEDEEKEKYKLPPGFNKMAVVYNLQRQAPGSKILVLVESFLSVFKLYQAGFSQAVTLMGSKLSDQQETLIADFLGPAGQVVLLFDADDAGRNCANDSLSRLSARLFVKTLDIGPLAPKPHRASEADLQALLAPYF
jgi:DNA primase